MSAQPGNVLSAARMALAVKRFKEERPDSAILNADPIAIVGIGCRFPGNVRTPEDCWRVLADGIDAVTEVPGDRWPSDEYYDPDPKVAGKTNSRWGGFIPDASLFDPVLFGISPREAASIDPQQRLLLEVAWEGIQDSGRAPESLAGSRTGVFMGICSSDYERLSLEDAFSINSNTCTGAYRSVASGRISYLLDLRGPSVSVDTACSSSLVAVHNACQSLRSGESDLALAGGVSLHLLPEHYVGLARLGMLAADGRCKPFDAAGDGFVPSEGCGLVLLRRLSDALADGDRIYAVIRGSAINQDGRSNSLTAPSGLAQQDVVLAALRNGHVSPSSISYIETHGTGTALGDPIEVEALAAVLGAPVAGALPCVLGAAKSNFGHLEAAAGVLGLIKAALALHKEEIPANLHFKKLSPHISLEGTRFCIPTLSKPWLRGNAPRFAGVSAFGFSGTNAHLVLEESPLIPVRRTKRASDDACVLLVSARTPAALTEAARNYRNFLGGRGQGVPLYDICHASALRRTHYEERLAVTAGTHEELSGLIDEYLNDLRRAGIARGRASGKAESLVFVCSGQGSQWPRMGVSLLRQEPVFRAAIEECEDWIRRWAGWSVIEQLSAPEAESKLENTEYAQPAIFAIQVALARLLDAWGVKPAAVIGHSAGEVAAAHIAGVLSLAEAARIIVHRGRLMQAAAGSGKMAAVRLPAAAVFQELAPYGDAVSIAAVNSSESTVVSGDCKAIDALGARWRERGIGCVTLPVNYAFHSAQMQPFEAGLVCALGAVDTYPERIPIISTVFGRRASGGEFNAGYWGSNIRRTVQFAASLETACAMGLETWIEIAPHPVLLNSIGECLSGGVPFTDAVASMRRGQDARTALLCSLGALHSAGYPVSWRAVYPETAPPVALPAYPYQRQPFWLEPRTAGKSAPPNEAVPEIFELKWRPTRRRMPTRSAGGLWMVAGGDCTAAERLAVALNHRGITTKTGETDEWLQSESGARGLIWLVDARSGEEFEGANDRVLRRGMVLAQQLIKQHSSAPPQFWLVTQGTAATGAAAGEGLFQSPLWGLFRSVAMEHPELRCVRVDLDPAAPDFDALADEVANWDGEEEIAFHARGRYVPRVVAKHRTARAKPADCQIRAHATYLVTGGMGAIGLRSAEWLIGKGAKSLVLVGRRDPSPHASERVGVLRGRGARITIRTADVANRDQMGAILTDIERELPPLAGVLHAAGVLDDGVFMEQTWDRMKRVLAPKAIGAWNLHYLTAGTALDFFLLFSSVASLTGSPGQSSYAAANAFLDALAHYRHRRGLPALSVNWGAWAGGGMAAQTEEAGLRRVLPGIRPMKPEHCFAALESVISEGPPQVVIADADWSRWDPAPRLLSALVPCLDSHDTRQQGTEQDDGHILSRLATASPGNRRSVLVDYLRGQLNPLLGFDGRGPYIDERQSLLRLGMDSLMAVEFRNVLTSAFGRPLSATLVFDHPTIGALADFLNGAPAHEDGLPQRDALLEKLETLSDSEAEELLKAELNGN